MLILTGGPDPNTGETVASVGVATRMIQTFSFFTIQSNILVLIVAATLVINLGRDGRIWRILRLDALLGITITGLVFDLVLIHDEHPVGGNLSPPSASTTSHPGRRCSDGCYSDPGPASTAPPWPGHSSGQSPGLPYRRDTADATSARHGDAN